MSLAKRKIMPRNEPEQSAEVRPEELRLLEAMLFASAEPLDEKDLAARLPEGTEPRRCARAAAARTMPSAASISCASTASGRSAPPPTCRGCLSKETTERRKLSRAAIETLAIIAYHQPVTRSEIEELRGVSTSAGSVDVLLETGWIRPRGRRKTPGRPVTYGTTAEFLSHFGLDAGRRSARPRRAERRRHVRRPAAARLLGADAVRRCGVARRRGPAGAGRPRPWAGAALRALAD